MNNPKVSIIAAIGENRELGKGNKLLWHISEDLKRFKFLTQGRTIIMGRKTYESIGKPLPQRTNIVITRNVQSFNRLYTGALFVSSMNEALNRAKEVEKEEIFIIGGGQIYQEAIKYASKLYLTLIKGSYEADTFFPNYSMFTKIVKKEEREEKGQKFTFIELVR